MEDTYTRKEVIQLIKRQREAIATSFGRMDAKADDMAIMKRIRKCQLVKVSKKK